MFPLVARLINPILFSMVGHIHTVKNTNKSLQRHVIWVGLQQLSFVKYIMVKITKCFINYYDDHLVFSHFLFKSKDVIIVILNDILRKIVKDDKGCIIF